MELVARDDGELALLVALRELDVDGFRVALASGAELVLEMDCDFSHEPDVPWPVRRGGWILRVYENSLGLAFVVLCCGVFVLLSSGTLATYVMPRIDNDDIPLADRLRSPKFGDSYGYDVIGARSAGLSAILLDRMDAYGSEPELTRIRSLSELVG